MKIGRLEKVDLRTLWKKEDRDFTPWLAQEENIKLLGEAIGFDLQVINQEESVGSFRADILCKDNLSDNYIVIENQLERTDHNHLGQLITYAAGLNASTIIWISPSFTEEHRAALDMLNNITDETFQCFGIEIELYRIGNSEPAPLFNIISKPNNWSKQVKKAASQSELSDTQLFQMEFWQACKNYMEEHKSFVKMRNPLPRNWSDISIGKSDIYVSAAVYSKTKTIEIWLVLVGENAKNNFDKLYELAFNSSLKEIDKEIAWDRMDKNVRSAVILRKQADYFNKADWDNQFQWFKENLENYVKFFKPLLTKI